ncbi:MAG: hypothetical protein QXW44_07105 [Pyrobaculum sp.]
MKTTEIFIIPVLQSLYIHTPLRNTAIPHTVGTHHVCYLTKAEKSP